MRKLTIVFPLIAFFALAIFVSSCSDDFTEEDALLLQGDLLEQKLRTESELATALAQLQGQLATQLAEKQAELERTRLELEAELAEALANRQAEIDSLKAAQDAAIAAADQAAAAALAAQAAQLQAEIDSLTREHQAELAAALAVLQAELDALAAEQAAAIDSLKAVYEAELDEQAREHAAEMEAMLAELQAMLDSMLAEQQNAFTTQQMLLMDSLARVGGIINYSVNVVPAGNASFGGGVTAAKTNAAGIRVIASQNGMTFESVTDAGGIAHFPNMRIGNTAVTVLGSEVDHTDLRFVVNLTVGTQTGQDFSKITRNAGTRVALFPVGDSPLAATINGRIEWEADLTNDEKEVAPVGLPILARLDVNNSTFRSRYFNTNANSMTGANQGGTIISMSYDPAVSRGAVVSADGGYVIAGAPASLDGLELELLITEFAADQTLLTNNLDDRDYPRYNVLDADEIARLEAQGKVATVRTLFGTTVNNPSAIPNVAAAFARVDPPSNSYVPGNNATSPVTSTPGSGAAGVGVVGPISGSIQRIDVTNAGSGYHVAPSVTLPAPETIGGVQATAVALLNAQGNVQSVVITNPGSGYQGNNYAPTFTAVTPNATAVASVTYSVTGVSGPTFDPLLGSPAAFATSGAYTLASVAPTVTIVGGNGGGPDAAVSANMTTAVYGATVTDGGSGYTSVPTVSISQPGGAGTGAQATATLRYRVTSVTVASPTGFYSAAPSIAFAGGGTPDATGTAVLGNTGRANLNAAAGLANGSWEGGVYRTSDNHLVASVNGNGGGPNSVLDDLLAARLLNPANPANLISNIINNGADLNPATADDGQAFEINARNAGWITDNGGTGLDIRVQFVVEEVIPSVPGTIGDDTNPFTVDRQVRVTGITIPAQGTGYDASNPPVLTLNYASIIGRDAAATTAGVFEQVRTQANLQSSLLVERQIASITVVTGGSYTNPGDPTISVPNTPANAALLLGGTLETNGDFTITTTGFVSALTITQVGSGYDPTDLPTINFIGGGGTGAAADLTFAQTVAGWNVDNGSFGYTQSALVSIAGGTLVTGGTAAGAPTLVYGDGKVTSAQILNPGSGIIAPNGTVGGTISGTANQVGGVDGRADFTFTVAGGQLTGVTIDKVGSWTTAGFPSASTNFLIAINGQDPTGTTAAVGLASNTNAQVRAAMPGAYNAGILPIMGVVDVEITSGGSNYNNGATATFAAPAFVGTGASTATGTAVLVGGVVQDVTITSSGVYENSGNGAGPVTITFAGVTSTVTPGTPATGGTYADDQAQALIGLTVDARTGRVVDVSFLSGGRGYEEAPEVHVFASIPGVGSGAELTVTGFTPINTGSNPNNGGTITAIRVDNGGSGYFGRNYPDAPVGVVFNGANSANSLVEVVSGGSHAKDIYLGTGRTTARLN